VNGYLYSEGIEGSSLGLNIKSNRCRRCQANVRLAGVAEGTTPEARAAVDGRAANCLIVANRDNEPPTGASYSDLLVQLKPGHSALQIL